MELVEPWSLGQKYSMSTVAADGSENVGELMKSVLAAPDVTTLAVASA